VVSGRTSSQVGAVDGLGQGDIEPPVLCRGGLPAVSTTLEGSHWEQAIGRKILLCSGHWRIWRIWHKRAGQTPRIARIRLLPARC